MGLFTLVNKLQKGSFLLSFKVRKLLHEVTEDWDGELLGSSCLDVGNEAKI